MTTAQSSSVCTDMAAGSRSKNHHWWPLGLQTYWADDAGDVFWIEPDGKIYNKKTHNKKIGYNKHGHTIFRGDAWESNFEDEFGIDNEVHRVISNLKEFLPLGRAPSNIQNFILSFRKKDRDLSETCAIHSLGDREGRNLLLLIYSLLIRSPSNRWRYENFPAQFGLPASENVGKANMRQSYLLAKKLCQQGIMTNRFFTVLHADHRHFICGDGYFDRLSDSLQMNRVSGRALIPLTPNLCVYVCTPTYMRTGRNFAALRAPPWMVDRVNEITQVHSRDKLFFHGQKPRLTRDFLARQFLTYTDYSIDLLDDFDEIAQPSKRGGHGSLFGNLPYQSAFRRKRP